MASKRKRIIFKKVPVDMREHLHEITGNELKVWLYYRLRSGADDTSYPSNDLVAKETGLGVDTVKTCKKNLRAKGWTDFQPQRRRGDGSWTTAVERAAFPWMKLSTTEEGARGRKMPPPAVVENTDVGKCHHKVDTDFKVTAPTPEPIRDLKYSASPSLDGSQSVSQSTPPSAAVVGDVQRELDSFVAKRPWLPRDQSGSVIVPEPVYDFYDRAGSEEAVDTNVFRDYMAAVTLLERVRLDEASFVISMVLNGRIPYYMRKGRRPRDFWWIAEHFAHARILAEETLVADAAKKGEDRWDVRAPWNWECGKWLGIPNSNRIPDWNSCEHETIIQTTGCCWQCGCPAEKRAEQEQMRQQQEQEQARAREFERAKQERRASLEFRKLTEIEKSAFRQNKGEGWEDDIFPRVGPQKGWPPDAVHAAGLWMSKQDRLVTFEEFEIIVCEAMDAQKT